MAREYTNKHVMVVRGFPYSNAPWFLKKNVEEAMDYVPHDGDIVMASYPKTGSTWLQYIVMQILSKGELFPSFDEIVTKVAPFMEMAGHDLLENVAEPRVYKHHLPYNSMRKNDKAKVIYSYRNPEDTFVSYYHFMTKFHPMEFNECFDYFLSGDIPFGSYFEHILSYQEHKDEENVLMVSYERLKSNCRGEILKIAKFLGDNYYKDIANSEEILNSILEKTSFDYMKKNLSLAHPKDIAEGKDLSGSEKVEFFRKGVIGEGKKVLTANQLLRLREVASNVLKGTDIINEWMSD